MARSKTPERYHPVDLKYGRLEVTLLINRIMKDGKKSKAQAILYKAFDLVEKSTNRNPIEILEEAIENIRPEVEVISKRYGGANFQVPVSVRPKRKEQLWMRWLIKAAKSRPENTMWERLGNELIVAAKGEGNAVKMRKGVYKSAESHKAYAHLR